MMFWEIFLEIAISLGIPCLLGYLLWVTIDRKAKEYAELPSEELFEKVVSAKNIMSIGTTFMITGGVIAIVSCLIPLIIGICSGPLEILPANWSSISFTIGGVATMYSMIVPMLIGLFIFSVGGFQTGMVSRALNMYLERKSEPWEVDFVNRQINIEETAQQVRSDQIAGDLMGDNFFGNTLKAKGTIDALPIMKAISPESNKWVVTITIIGLVVFEIAWVFIFSKGL